MLIDKLLNTSGYTTRKSLDNLLVDSYLQAKGDLTGCGSYQGQKQTRQVLTEMLTSRS